MLRSTSLLLAAALAATPAGVHAADPAVVPPPQMRPGDSWVFDQTFERGTAGFSQNRQDLRVESVDSDAMVVGVKPEGSPTNYEDHVLGLDWSKRRNFDGKDVVTTRPFAFPLAIGKTWSADWEDPTRRGNALSARFHADYKVVGWEEVTTSAGAFRALKIEGLVHVDARMAAASAASMAGSAGAGGGVSSAQVAHLPERTVHETWRDQLYYAPEVKNYVKFVSEHYNADEVRILRQTDLLVSYKVQP
jgi:hypothetical protein